MKKVLEMANGLGLGGTEKTMQIFCKYLDKSKYEVFACGVFTGGVRENLIKSNVRELLIANGDIQRIKEFVIRNNIDIVHWHSISQSGEEFEKSINLLKFFRENNIRIIETSQFSLFNEQIDNLLDTKLLVSKTNLIKYFWKFGDRIKDKDKYYYLYNPLDIDELSKFRLDASQRLELRKKYGIDKDAFVVGKVGRASLWKWDDSIIDVVPYLCKKIPNLKIVIRAIPEIKKKKIQRMGIEKYFVYLPESVDEKDICETYQLMDIMLHTSRIGETFGVALAEGMFFGIPVITKSTDFMQKTLFDRDNAQLEVVEDEINGFIQNTPKSMAKRILELKEDNILYQKISQNNIKKSQQVFGAESLVLLLQGIFDDTLVKGEYNDINWYQNHVKAETFFSIRKENLKSVIDKFIYKA